MNPSPYTEILSERLDEGAIVRLTLNRPDRRNPLGMQTMGELHHALEAARDDDAVRVVAITGAGKVFSAGGDLSQMGGRGGSTASGAVAPVPPKTMADLLTLMTRLGKPIVAVLNGHALAGGAGLALACDLIVAAEEAEIGTPEVNVGLWPMQIMTSLFRSMPRKRAMEMILLAERIPAREAEQWGLVNRVWPRERLEEESLGFLRLLAARSPAAVRLGLLAFHDTDGRPLPEQLPRLEKGLLEVLGTADAREGLSAFMEKRTPSFTGK
jgi:enoyl-CoA hydratase/carnithine racemase